MLHAIEKAKTGILTIPALQDVFRRAVNLRTDLLDQFDERMEGVARKLNLATRKETKALRRQIRELENQVQGLEGQLTHERRRAEDAESALGEALKAAKAAVKEAAKLVEPKVQPQLALAPAPRKVEPTQPDQPLPAEPAEQVEAIADKPTTKRSARAKKKNEPEATEAEAEAPASETPSGD